MPCPVLPCPALPNGDKAAQMSARPLDTWRRKTHVTLGQPLKKLLRGVTQDHHGGGLCHWTIYERHTRVRSPRHNSGRLTAYGPALPVLCSTSETSPSSHSVSLRLSASQPNGTHRHPVPVRLNGLLVAQRTTRRSYAREFA